MFAKGVQWHVGIGDMVAVFKDSWIRNDANFYVDLVSLSGFEHMMVSDLVHASEHV